MTLNHSIPIATVIAACLAILPAARADEAKEVFNSLFAAKMKTATSTVDRADDIALAKELLALAKTSTDQADLLVLVCEAAQDLGGKHADGYATAVEAMQLLADTVADKRPAAREKLILLLTKQSTAGKPDERDDAGEALVELLTTIGDESAQKKQYAEAMVDYRRAVSAATLRKSVMLEVVKGKLEFATGRDRAAKSIARLQERLLKDANDHAAAEEIAKLYVIELDDPAPALPLLNRMKDEKLKMLLPLAAKPVGDLSEEQCLSLAEFYRAGAASLKGPSKVAMLNRSKQCVDRFIATHTTADLQLTKANAWLKEIVAELDNLSAAPGTVIDVLAKVDVKSHTRAGRFTLSDGRLSTVARGEWQALHLPYHPKGDYELRIRFTKTAGGAFDLYLARDGRKGIYLLIGDGIVSKEMNAGSKVVPIIPNAYRPPGDVKPHVLRAIVKAKRIVIVLDNVKIIDYPFDFEAMPADPDARNMIAASDITLSIDQIVVIE